MALMRHKSIETTVRRDLARNAITTADALWDAERQRDLLALSRARRHHRGRLPCLCCLPAGVPHVPHEACRSRPIPCCRRGFIARERLYAETRTAADLTPEAVGKAIDAAKDGDTVQLPEGTAVWSKGWNAGHDAKIKAITLQGAGIDKTIIRDGRNDPGGPPFLMTGVEGKPFRVTGITLDGTGYRNAGNWGGLMTIRGNCKNFRIDHCKFRNTDCMLSMGGDMYGLIDHCRFEADQSHGGNVQPVDFSGPGGANYRKPLTLGTAEAMFFEDNEVHIAWNAGTGGRWSGNNPWIAPNNCARVVIRHNSLVNSQIEIYTPGRNHQYGCQQCEIYDNEFSTEGKGKPQLACCCIAAGVGMVFNNTVTGPSVTRTIMLTEVRAYHLMDPSHFAKPDGTNPIDGNQIPAGQVGAGYPCMGQVGRATNLEGGKVFDPTPCYAWNNTLDGKPLLMAVRGVNADEKAIIKEGRDFFNEKPPEGSYKPYVYPHPLQGGWEALMKSVAAP